MDSTMMPSVSSPLKRKAPAGISPYTLPPLSPTKRIKCFVRKPLSDEVLTRRVVRALDMLPAEILCEIARYLHKEDVPWFAAASHRCRGAVCVAGREKELCWDISPGVLHIGYLLPAERFKVVADTYCKREVLPEVVYKQLTKGASYHNDRGCMEKIHQAYWRRFKDVLFSVHDVVVAVEDRALDVLEFFLEIGIPSDSSRVARAAASEDCIVMNWLIERNHVSLLKGWRDVAQTAYDRKVVPVILLLARNGMFHDEWTLDDLMDTGMREIYKEFRPHVAYSEFSIAGLAGYDPSSLLSAFVLLRRNGQYIGDRHMHWMDDSQRKVYMDICASIPE